MVWGFEPSTFLSEGQDFIRLTESILWLPVAVVAIVEQRLHDLHSIKGIFLVPSHSFFEHQFVCTCPTVFEVNKKCSSPPEEPYPLHLVWLYWPCFTIRSLSFIMQSFYFHNNSYSATCDESLLPHLSIAVTINSATPVSLPYQRVFLFCVLTRKLAEAIADTWSFIPPLCCLHPNHVM